MTSSSAVILVLVLALAVSACAGTLSGPRVEAPRPVPPSTPGAMEPAYRIYTAEGRPASLEKVVAAASGVAVVFVGELHDDSIGHRLQRTLLEALHARYGKQRPVAISLEMFDREVQHIVDEYLAGAITERHFVADSRAWGNYAVAYRPLVEYARVHGLDVIAANAPRRYVNRVSRLGPAALDSLGERALAALPPLPYPEPSTAYRAKWDRVMGAAAGHGAASSASDTAAAGPGAHAPAPGVSNMLHAQALWDATMAYSIAEYLAAHPAALVVHVTGGFHVEGGTGTPEALRHYRPDAEALVVALRPAADVEAFTGDHANRGDFVVLTASPPGADGR